MLNADMVNKLIREQYLNANAIIDAFLAVDRADFVLEEYKDYAYENYPLPIGFGQTISQPATVAFMLELLQPKVGDKVMDVGSGSGWQTAILASIVGEEGSHDSAKASLDCVLCANRKALGQNGSVYAVERIPEFCEFGRRNLQKYNFMNIYFLCKDATKGLPEHAPFDGIIAAAAGSEIPPAWLEQLKIGGRIVVPVDSNICLYIKKSETEFEKQEYPGFAFVPLIID